MRFVNLVRDCLPEVRFPQDAPAGDVITFKPQRSGAPSEYGAALSPVWEVLSPLLRESAQFKAISQAKFMIDPRRGLMRVISPDKVWRLCEVVADPDGGLPQLKVHIPAFTELGIKQHDERKRWLRLALASRDESGKKLTLALGDFNVTLPGDYRLDLADGGRDYTDDPIGAWIQENFGDFWEVGYEGFSRAGRRDGRVRFLSALDHVLCDLGHSLV